MSAIVEFLLNKASAVQIIDHLLCCDADFVPPLSGRVEIRDYAKKIASNATRFEAWSGDIPVGLVAAYCNDQENRIAYITSVSVLKEWTRKGIAAGLVGQCVEHAMVSGMRQISLTVAAANTPAIKLYEKSGFIVSKANGPFVDMNLYLKSGEEHE
jgi:ribosomal protein S18 acetylase RimI-like enzyme